MTLLWWKLRVGVILTVVLIPVHYKRASGEIEHADYHKVVILTCTVGAVVDSILGANPGVPTDNSFFLENSMKDDTKQKIEDRILKVLNKITSMSKADEDLRASQTILNLQLALSSN